MSLNLMSCIERYKVMSLVIKRDTPAKLLCFALLLVPQVISGGELNLLFSFIAILMVLSVYPIVNSKIVLTTLLPLVLVILISAISLFIFQDAYSRDVYRDILIFMRPVFYLYWQVPSAHMM